MGIEPHVHEYAIRVKALTEGEMMLAFCTHPECDRERDAQEILSYLNWVEKYKDGLKQIGASF